MDGEIKERFEYRLSVLHDVLQNVDDVARSSNVAGNDGHESSPVELHPVLHDPRVFRFLQLCFQGLS